MKIKSRSMRPKVPDRWWTILSRHVDLGAFLANPILRCLEGDPITVYWDGSKPEDWVRVVSTISSFLGKVRAKRRA